MDRADDDDDDDDELIVWNGVDDWTV